MAVCYHGARLSHRLWAASIVTASQAGTNMARRRRQGGNAPRTHGNGTLFWA